MESVYRPNRKKIAQTESIAITQFPLDRAKPLRNVTPVSTCKSFPGRAEGRGVNRIKRDRLFYRTSWYFFDFL